MENLCDNMTRQRDAPYPKSSIVYISLTLNVIRGHCRSLIRSLEVKVKVKNSMTFKYSLGT